MCTESTAELHKLVQQYISTIKIEKIKCETLNEFCAVLSRLGFKDKRTIIQIKSVLADKFRRNKIPYSSLEEVYRYLKNFKKPRNDFQPLREIYDEANQGNVHQNVIKPTSAVKIEKKFEYTYRLRSSRQSTTTSLSVPILEETKSRFEIIKSSSTNVANPCVPISVPTTYLSDTPTTQEKTTKSTFFEYFNLRDNSIESCPNKLDGTPNFTMSMFKYSANVPFSSELGRLLAGRVNHNVTDDFKLRKIERLERYINRPYIEKNENIIYPITYVERNHVNNSKKNPINNVNKDLRNSEKECSMGRNFPCKQLSVLIENENLIELQKKFRQRMKKRKRDRLYRLRKKCKYLRVLLRTSDRTNIEKIIKTRKRK